jgi:hypothetical protein
MDISKIWKKLNIFNHTTKLSQNSSNDDKELIGSLTFNVYSDNKVKIECALPDLEKLNDDKILDYSEYYANLLFHVNEGKFINDIILILNNDKTSDQELLFNKNILSFWAFFHKESLIDQNNENEPVISPINVFRK